MKFNFKNVKIDTWARTALLLVAIVISIIEWNKDGGDLASITMSVFTSLVSIYAFWKNNSFTENAQRADEYMKGADEDVNDQ